MIVAPRLLWCSTLSRIEFSLSLLRFMSTGKKKVERWRDFFSNPSHWWDHRTEKMNPRFPDFKHKHTGEGLWLDDPRNPPWVKIGLVAIPPGTLKSTVFSFNQRLKRYGKARQFTKTLELFHQMEQEGILADRRTFVPVLNACAGLGDLEEGKRVHAQIITVGCESDVYVATCLVDMYVKCGSIKAASIVFNKMPVHDVVAWNAMITGYVKSGHEHKALELFRVMQQDRVELDTVTLLGALNACAGLAALKEGRRVHEQIIQRGCESNIFLGSSLIDMYAKCGSIDDARCVFNKMPERDVVVWNAMIGGYVSSGQWLKAVELFCIMQREGVEPDEVTFVGVLNACASVAALEEGKRVHKQIIRSSYESHVFVASSLVDMYAKCGSIDDARSVFNKMPKRDVVAWNAMIGGYAMHGHVEKAIELFERMGEEGVELDGVTFLCLLSACSHRGLVKEGIRYFNSMNSRFHITPTADHYSCMVDLLGRAGWLAEAEELLNTMPVETGFTAWMALVSACRIHGNIEMAERAAKRCQELEPEDASGYVALSNIYAAAGKWDKSEEEISRRVTEEAGSTRLM